MQSRRDLPEFDELSYAPGRGRATIPLCDRASGGEAMNGRIGQQCQRTGARPRWVGLG